MAVWGIDDLTACGFYEECYLLLCETSFIVVDDYILVLCHAHFIYFLNKKLQLDLSILNIL